MKNYIKNTVNELIKKYKTRNPFEILSQLGVSVELNSSLGFLKGFFTIVNGRKFVIINQSLSFEEQKAIAAHELGHCCLHSHIAENDIFRDFMICDMETKPEYEANFFAGLLLISNEEIKYAASLGYSQKQMAAYLNIDEKLLKIRLSGL